MHPPGQIRWSVPLSAKGPSSALVRVAARALLAGEQAEQSAVARLMMTFGHPWRWIAPLVRRYVKRFAGQVRPRRAIVVRFLWADEAFLRACERHRPRLVQWIAGAQKMQPVFAARAWPIRQIATVAELAEWLEVTVGELEWFADRRQLGAKGREAGGSALEHYHYRVLAKAAGAPRLIEAPKARLKQMQRKILREILDRIPAHEAAHGFRPGRSIKTFAAPHVGKAVVLRMDVHDFFPTFSGARMQAFFRTAGYPEAVADLLAGVCMNAVPRAVWKACGVERGVMEAVERVYARPHLPQGAPASPALSNCMAYRLDCRLAAVAKAAGAVYTRYADDLAFSGGEDFARGAERFAVHVAAILQEEGFAAHFRKTRVMRRGVRQHLAGLVVNERLNVSRADFDRLKAILTNCVRLGPASQNREDHLDFRAHLLGRVAFFEMVNPGKAVRLRRVFEGIVWG